MNIKIKNEKVAKIIKNIKVLLLFIYSLFCIFIPEHILVLFPYIVGSTLIIYSIIQIIFEYIENRLKQYENSKIPEIIIKIILGCLIIIKGHDSINLIAIVWGVSGIYKGTRGFKVVIYNKSQKEKYVLEALHSLLELGISLALIFNPTEKIVNHIILFGITTIVILLKRLFKDRKYAEEKEDNID